MSPTEQVARWLHETFIRRSQPRPEHVKGSWAKQDENVKNDYRVVAAELLTNPPLALVEALKEKVK